MRRPLPLVCLLTVMLTACGCVGSRVVAKPDVGAAELRPIVERDLVTFESESVPQAVVDTLSAYKVVIVGEYHQVSGSIALGGQITVALQSAGLRQVLLECPQAYSWMLEAYVQGDIDGIEGITPKMYLPLLDQIRSLNSGLPAVERVHVGAIDINHSYMDLRLSLRTLANLLRSRSAVDQFLSDVGTGQDNTAAAAALRQKVEADPTAFATASGVDYSTQLKRLLDIDLRSSQLRGNAVASAGPQATAREGVMKELVDACLAGCDGKTLIYTGFYHAQKTTYMGTEAEFYGRYLHVNSPQAQGACFSLVIVPTSGKLKLGNSVRAIDATKNPADDLFKVMCDVSGRRKAFIHLSDPLFAERKVLLSYYERTIAVPPSSQFDGFVLLPNVAVEPVPTK